MNTPETLAIVIAIYGALFARRHFTRRVSTLAT